MLAGGEGLLARRTVLLKHDIAALIRIKCQQDRGNRLHTSPCQRRVEPFGIGPDCPDIVHQASTVFGSTYRAVQIEISYSAISGSAKADCVITSGGVMIAAMMNMPT